MAIRRMIPRALRLIATLALLARANGWLTTKPFVETPTTTSSNRLDASLRPTTTTTTTTTRLQASKFSQPAFSQPAFTGSSSSNKNKRRKPTGRKYGADSKIASLHAERTKTAGRVGTKRYVDPCKVFFGNLPFNITENVLEGWIADRMGVPAPLLLRQVKVIRDWKTGKSKGYGFAIFTEAIHGTVCIEKCNGKYMGGRALSVNQGKKKETTQVFVKKKKKPAMDAEEAAIQAGMEEASRSMMDPQEALMLRQLDPDLVEDSFDNDDDLFDEADLDDDGVDGFYFEDDEEDFMDDDETPMNREKRREAARQKKRRKPSNKGFGSTP